ncbi:MAG: NAD-binding protein [Nitrososphaerota archaeon]|nr:NAD-binding protein [Nitrososphaerota archaeon]
MKALIVGAGRIGTLLSELMVKEGWEVILLEKDKETAERVSTKVDALVINADALDRGVVKELDLSNVDVAITTTSDDKTNVLVCEVMKRMGIQKTISRVTQPENYDIFLDFGITPINESTIIVDAILKTLYTPHKERILTTINDSAAIVRITVDEDSPFLNKKAKTITGGKQVICVHREGEAIIPDDKTFIRNGDTVYMIVTLDELKRMWEPIRR